MISDGIYFRNVIIQALKDLVLESFVLLLCSLSAFVFGFVWVFSLQCICVFFLGYMLGSYPCELSRHMAGTIIGSSVPPHCQLSNQVESLLFR